MEQRARRGRCAWVLRSVSNGAGDRATYPTRAAVHQTATAPARGDVAPDPRSPAPTANAVVGLPGDDARVLELALGYERQSGRFVAQGRGG